MDSPEESKVRDCICDVGDAIQKTLNQLKPHIGQKHSIEGLALDNAIGNALISVGLQYLTPGKVINDKEFGELFGHIQYMICGLLASKTPQLGG